jgi:hypothetical protein
MLRSVDWQSVTDVSTQPVGSMFEGQEVRVRHGTDRLSRTSVTDYESKLRNVPEERRSHTAAEARNNDNASHHGRFECLGKPL